MAVEQGDFVEVRGRQWLVEAINDAQPDLTTVKLSCIADDAQGEQIEVLWDAEIGASGARGGRVVAGRTRCAGQPRGTWPPM